MRRASSNRPDLLYALERLTRAAALSGARASASRTCRACEQLPEQLDSGVGLCLLRVVQEALHNVAKHSRATKVRVTLTGLPDSLALAVTDDGVGFDVSEAGLAEGIGLISMRERVCFVGGTFNLSSTPGRGTHLEAHVPIAHE